MNNYIFKIIHGICSRNNIVRAMISQSSDPWEEENEKEREKKRDNSFRANNVRAVQTEIQTNSNCPINFQLRMKYADDSWRCIGTIRWPACVRRKGSKRLENTSDSGGYEVGGHRVKYGRRGL